MDRSSLRRRKPLRMIPRWFLAALVFALPILMMTFAVVLGASRLANGLGDTAGSRGLFWIAMASLILIAIDLPLLVIVLGLRELERRDN
jgi:branched-subunit amino acid permease